MTDHLGRNVAAGVAGLVVAVLLLASAALGGASGRSVGGGTTPSPASVAAIPPGYLTAYIGAAANCPGLSWSVLAAIGEVESGQGRDDQASFAGAVGPMQFEPATFAEYAEPVPPGGADPPSPYDATDAIYAAARLLCANGAANGIDLPDAIYAYNHAWWYVDEVLTLAGAYAGEMTPTGATGAPSG